MPKYVTYMEVNISSEGVPPSTLAETLKKIGWKPCYGRYDFAYEWGNQWGEKDTNMQEYFDHLNRTHHTLQGCNVNYCCRTYEKGRENFHIKPCD